MNLEIGPVRVAKCRQGWMQFFETDLFVGRSLDLYGEFGEGQVELFSQMIKPGDVVLDAGANVGSFTLVFSKLAGPRGMVIAVEPQRQLYFALCGMLNLNGIINTHPSCMALGNRQAQVAIPWFNMDKQADPSGLQLGWHTQGDLVPMVPLDTLQLGERGLKFIKSDVEGMERELLEGGEKTIMAQRPVIYLENDKQKKSKRVIEWLFDHDYAVWWHGTELYQPDNFKGCKQNRHPNVISVDLLCLPRERAQEVLTLKLKRAFLWHRVKSSDDWWNHGQPTLEKIIAATA